jgi:hypothetical protein
MCIRMRRTQGVICACDAFLFKFARLHSWYSILAHFLWGSFSHSRRRWLRDLVCGLSVIHSAELSSFPFPYYECYKSCPRRRERKTYSSSQRCKSNRFTSLKNGPIRIYEDGWLTQKNRLIQKQKYTQRSDLHVPLTCSSLPYSHRRCALSPACPLTWSLVRPPPPSRLGSRVWHQSLAVCISSAVLHKISKLVLFYDFDLYINGLISLSIAWHYFVLKLIYNMICTHTNIVILIHALQTK